MPFIKQMRHISPYAVLGLGGVDKKESLLAQTIGKYFTYSLWVLSILLLYEWHVEIYGSITALQLRVINFMVWAYFLLALIFVLYNIKDKRHFLVSNWLWPLVLLLGIPTLLTPNALTHSLAKLRPLLAIYLLIPSLSLLWHFFIDGKLRTTLLAALFIVCLFGVLISSIDPNIHSIVDGIWWAVATVSAVGYGDVVPTSPLGRLLGIVLIVLGIGIIVAITANFIALLLAKGQNGGEIHQLTQDVADIKETLAKLEQAHSAKPHNSQSSASQQGDGPATGSDHPAK